jgi:hypothetical protein
VIFLRPNPTDITLILDILQLFGKASGLQTNVHKSSVLPIRCNDQILNAAKELLSCQFVDFPSKYLHLPLSLGKLSKNLIQVLVDRVGSMLPGWRAELMNRAGCVVHVQFVMTARIIYTAMAVEFPTWAFKAIEKLQKGFVWKGRKEDNGGRCLLAWPKVARPKDLGGLGIQDVRQLSLALRARWPWMQKTDLQRPWAQFQIQMGREVQSLIDMAVVTVIGDGSDTLFWKDRWFDGRKIQDIAPNIYAMVPKRVINRRRTSEALQNMSWIADFRGALTVAIILEFVELYQRLDEVVLQEGVSDTHIWKLLASGQFSNSSAYRALFQGGCSL